MSSDANVIRDRSKLYIFSGIILRLLFTVITATIKRHGAKGYDSEQEDDAESAAGNDNTVSCLVGIAMMGLDPR